MAEISIIVPVYRAESYLADCIDSILSQTISDLEVILVDDGSPDNSGAICDDYARRDSRVRVCHQENQGQAAARNHAMEIATGKWICFVDSDDLIHPRMVESLYEAVKDTGAAISMCRMLESPSLPEDFFRERKPEFTAWQMDDQTLAALFDRDEYPAWVACAKLIPRELVEGYLFTPGRVYEDNEAVCRWVCQGGSIAVTEEMLYYYRTNPISTTQVGFSPRKRDYLWALESILLFYRDKGYAAMTERFCDLYAWETVTQCDQLYALGRKDQVKAIRKQALRYLRKNRIPMPKKLQEVMLRAFYPRLNRILWSLKEKWNALRKG